MAQPIRKTPTLNEEESKRFIENMLKTEKRNINKKEEKFVDIISG